MKPSRFKFRAWNKKGKEFIEIDTLSFFSGYGIDDKHIEDDVVFHQSTGLLDKNGKLIFEGDILNVVSKNNGEETILTMEFKNHSIGDFKNWDIVGFRDYSKSTYGHIVEIIGNKFEGVA